MASGEPSGTRAADRIGPLPRLALIAVLAAAVLLAGGLAWAALDDHGEETQVVTPGPSSTVTSITTDATATTTVEVDWTGLPVMGVAIQPLDGPVELYDLEGRSLGNAAAPADPVNGPRLVANPGQVGVEPVTAVEVPEGCASAEVAGGVRVALCGGSDGLPRRIDVVDSAGRATPLIEAGPSSSDSDTQQVVGHWRWATPSPDGRWVLAQWSGECESQQAVLIDTGTGDVSAIGGDEGSMTPESRGLGWALDRRAVIHLGAGVCGAGASEPGIYLLEPQTGELERIVTSDAPSDQAFLWTKRAWGNGPEWLFTQAQRELGLEGCCGEPSHGGAGVTAGAVFEGHDIGISGAPTGTPAATMPSSVSAQRVDLLHGEAVALSHAAGGPFESPLLAFTCGELTWWLSWWEDTTPEVDSMLLLAEKLVPRLGCTLGEPPDVMPHGDAPASAP